jgi:hypothetical protein
MAARNAAKRRGVGFEEEKARRLADVERPANLAVSQGASGIANVGQMTNTLEPDKD